MLRWPASLVMLAAVLHPAAPHAQSWKLPATANPAARDLTGATPVPFMSGSSRVQQFYTAADVGAQQLVASRVSFRFDGPSGGTARNHTIADLTVRVGATATGIDRLGSSFVANLSTPLTTVVSHARFSFTSDGLSTSAAQPFGGQLAIAFASPAAISIPNGGCLALEIVASGNSNRFLDPAQLDVLADPAPPSPLTTEPAESRGCPVAPQFAEARMEIAGNLQAGGSFSVFGDGYVPGAVVMTFVTAQLLDARLAVPGTSPVCWIYVDPDSGGQVLAAVADNGGRVRAGGDDTLVPLPRAPGMCGSVLYVQGFTPTRPWNGNPIGFVTTNYRTVTIGCRAGAPLGSWFAAHPTSASSQIATIASFGGYALCID